jgi:acetate kinase
MIEEAPSLRYDAEQRMVANEGGFTLLAEMREMRARIMALESQSQKLVSQSQKLESHRQKHMDIRQRAISTWVRDALNEDTERRKEEIRRLNKDVIHGGDVRSDAMVVTERYKKSSTEWQSFGTLYGLSPDDVHDLGIVYKFP